jgi:hypothetical protein
MERAHERLPEPIVMPQQIDALRAWARGRSRCRPAAPCAESAPAHVDAAGTSFDVTRLVREAP